MKHLLRFERQTEKIRWLVLLFILFQSSHLLIAQTTSPTNNPVPNAFLGWDNTVGSDLEITHNHPTRPIIFSTDNIERARIAANGRTRFGCVILSLAKCNEQGAKSALNSSRSSIKLYPKTGLNHKSIGKQWTCGELVGRSS
jgi:hypothetical protein